MPNARPRDTSSKAWVMSAIEPGTSSAPAAPWASRKTTSHSSDGARPQRAEVGREPGKPDRVDAPPAVVVGQGTGQDQQGGQRREVSADDVGLALEDADHRRRQLAVRSA